MGPRLHLLPPPASRFPHRCHPGQDTGPWRRTVHIFEQAWALAAEAGSLLRLGSASFSHPLSISLCLIVADPELSPLSDCCTYSLCIKPPSIPLNSPFSVFDHPMAKLYSSSGCGSFSRIIKVNMQSSVSLSVQLGPCGQSSSIPTSLFGAFLTKPSPGGRIA